MRVHVLLFLAMVGTIIPCALCDANGNRPQAQLYLAEHGTLHINSGSGINETVLINGVNPMEILAKNEALQTHLTIIQDLLAVTNATRRNTGPSSCAQFPQSLAQ